FRQLIGLQASQILVPPNFMVMGAIGCAVLAARNLATRRISLARLGDLARTATCSASSRSWVMRLDVLHDSGVRPENHAPDLTTPEGPLVMGLDIGSVSVKGVIIDARGRIVKSHYKLSRSRVLEAVEETLEALGADACTPEVISVTGSGRYLVGRLVDADLILDEITAQATAAASHSSEVETVVEIGGQDSKWIVLEHGFVKDFEMNRVCAAGTGSFLTAQAERLDLAMGEPFSDAAFAAAKPADLGNRCTVFMESDLVHHQNNGASRDDLAAGVCISIVHNYLERVANHKPLGRRVLFLGGVAATDAVRAAFEQQTGSTFETPHFFLVSGALGAALKASDKLKRGEISPNRRGAVVLRHEQITRDQFTCNRCPNRCPVSKYDSPQRTVFHGGLCDRWEVEDRPASLAVGHDPFAVRVGLLEEPAKLPAQPGERAWGMIRAPQFYEWFPFWKSFCHELGIRLIVAPRIDRRQFQNGIRFL
ncbi:MAG: hypothetical protein FJY85_15020, partial [Deltaproteobacteria bacterium]|nr:hypothetical protein [Deltaproteobacteria bacterium]